MTTKQRKVLEEHKAYKASKRTKHEVCPNCNKRGVIINKGNFTTRRICRYCKWEESRLNNVKTYWSSTLKKYVTIPTD